MRRVVVTGLGLVSCLGHDFGSVVEALKQGRSGVRSMPEWDGRHGRHTTHRSPTFVPLGPVRRRSPLASRNGCEAWLWK